MQIETGTLISLQSIDGGLVTGPGDPSRTASQQQCRPRVQDRRPICREDACCWSLHVGYHHLNIFCSGHEKSWSVKDVIAVRRRACMQRVARD